MVKPTTVEMSETIVAPATRYFMISKTEVEGAWL